MTVLDRTRHHLERLAAAAAVASTVAAIDACRGYAVVDPMPRPSRCAGAAAAFKATAQWIDTPKGRRVELVLEAPASGQFRLGDVTKIRSGSGDTFDEVTPTATGVRLVIEIKSPPYAYVTVPVDCGAVDAGTSDDVQVTLDLGDGGTALTPTLSEY